ncbi:MltR family transcriptional regulator [Noviherbaspirillum saxi]|uniref:Mannitol repressor n=1 Tax=Noviherbaspirillum saxi TaxID=2320863 RepID=A0A3A3FMB3_9BURK|nr:MltR family transcriptional regulator [Noviherbaspirillum saxi]RJF92672.1 hypothetical protein D3871_29260 [Noviherbaspirillum saxi]
MNVKTPEYKRFEGMIAEVKTQSDRACALILAANLDNRLLELLKAFCIELGNDFSKSVFKGNGFMNSFSSKISLCFMLGLISSNEHHDLVLIRKIRNFFAHEEHGWNFQHQEIISRCHSLKMIQEMTKENPDLNADYTNPRNAFVLCAASLSLLLVDRAEKANEQKRIEPSPGRIL